MNDEAHFHLLQVPREKRRQFEAGLDRNMLQIQSYFANIDTRTVSAPSRADCVTSTCQYGDHGGASLAIFSHA